MASYTMYRGDDRALTITVTDTYSPSAKINFAVKPKSDVNDVDSTDAEAIFTATAASGDAVDNGNGTVTYTLNIPSSATTGKTPGKYIGEVEYVNGSGKHTTYGQFPFIINGDINQRS